MVIFYCNVVLYYCTVLLYCTIVLFCCTVLLYRTVTHHSQRWGYDRWLPSHCTVLYWTGICHHTVVPFCTLLYFTVLFCTVLYCTVLYCTVLYCIVLYCTVLYCQSSTPVSVSTDRMGSKCPPLCAIGHGVDLTVSTIVNIKH